MYWSSQLPTKFNTMHSDNKNNSMLELTQYLKFFCSLFSTETQMINWKKSVNSKTQKQ